MSCHPWIAQITETEKKERSYEDCFSFHSTASIWACNKNKKGYSLDAPVVYSSLIINLNLGLNAFQNA